MHKIYETTVFEFWTRDNSGFISRRDGQQTKGTYERPGFFTKGVFLAAEQGAWSQAEHDDLVKLGNQSVSL